MDNNPPIYTLRNASISFGLKPLFNELNVYIKRGDKISLIGRNGSGKSTLLKVIAGEIKPDNGELFTQPGIKISYMPQEANLSGYNSLREVVLSGLYDIHEEYKADILIDELEILKDQPPKSASGGECKKALLAKALVGEPDILLLDEPTNHLDVVAIEKLEEVIKKWSGAVVIISHDKAFLSNITNNMFWLDRGTMRHSDKGFSFFEKWQEQVIEQDIIEQKNFNKKLEEETEWLHKGVTARRKRNQGRLRRLIELREQRRNQIKQVGSVNFEIEKSEGNSKLVIEAKSISKAFGNRDIVKDFSLKVIRGNKIGIVGPNGAGKTTLIKLLTKKLDPDKGFVRIGKNLEEAYFDQTRMNLDLTKTLWKTLCEDGDHVFVRGAHRHVVAYLKDFLFKPEQANTPVSALSGGEKNRLMLAKILSNPSNFLVLDEPTNDLDMDTLDLLEEVLSEYDGTVLIISHDRNFLDKVATSLIYMKGDGKVIEFVGDYSALIKQIKEEEAVNALKNQPKEIKKEIETKQVSKKPTKLSFKDEYLLKTLPTEIAKLENEINSSENKLADPLFYQKCPEEFKNLANNLEKMKLDLEEKETKWLEIEMLKEELEG
ncbi:MAG: ABC transporter ATP-binding protein uup [Alphaproteobacteria bacterium ADurb.Bin438]|nr:MAG: ABC transporter ATP-binding protein uup [Alphaproteobacteria bacterium ADurb.Bin438]